VNTEDLKILLALEPRWTVSLNETEFLALDSSSISVFNSTIQFGPYHRKISRLEWLRPNVVRLQGRSRFRSRLDSITLYPGDRLPTSPALRKRRRAFQAEIGRALCSYFGVRKMERETLYSDRRYGIGGAYPRFIGGGHAAITVDPDEPAPIINGLMRAALLWGPLVRRPVAAVVPYGRHHTLALRLQAMPHVRQSIAWLQWDGERIKPFTEFEIEPETHVLEFQQPDAEAEVERICGIAPELLQAVPHIAGKAVSIRLRGIEVAHVSGTGVTYPLGEPLESVVQELDRLRRSGSRHPLSRAHEERWLESKLLAEMDRLLPAIDVRHIYPQVPSFAGEQRNVIDLLTVTTEGRLVVVEVKASPDPELPFQALDYWIAVERHRKAGDFKAKGYFAGCTLRDEPALLILVAPLLAYHKTTRRMISLMPPELPLLEIGVNQTWKEEIKILRRQGMLR
jgi:hypothetical protein